MAIIALSTKLRWVLVPLTENRQELMTPEQKAAFVFSQSVAAMAAIESMKVTNRERVSKGNTEAYDEKAFLEVIDNYNIGYNDVVGLFREH